MGARRKDKARARAIGWRIPLIALGIGVAAVALTMSVTLATGLSRKAQYEQQYAQLHPTGRAGPKNAPVSLPSSAPMQIQAGIANSHQGPYLSSQFFVSNSWRGPVDTGNKVWIAVFAGLNSPGNGATPSIPAVDVHRLTMNPDGDSAQDQELGFFAAPGATGGLTITSVNGFVLTLQTASGQIYRFNAASDKYL